jgi:hypothetical protein
MHVNTRIHKPGDFKALFIEPGLFVRTAEELGVSGTPHFKRALSEDCGLLAATCPNKKAPPCGGALISQSHRLSQWIAVSSARRVDVI